MIYFYKALSSNLQEKIVKIRALYMKILTKKTSEN